MKQLSITITNPPVLERDSLWKYLIPWIESENFQKRGKSDQNEPADVWFVASRVVLYYQIRSSSNEILVVAIANLHRKPEYWIGRI